MNRLRFFLVNILIVIALHSYAQDAGFTQFYANPLYLNPALAGVSGCTNLTINYRNQWPSINQGFNTYSAAIDHKSSALSGGLGLLVYNDDASGYLLNQHASILYSYHLRLGSNSQLNAGFEAGVHQRKINFDNLIFPDMIDSSTGQISGDNSSEIAPELTSQFQPDFAIGFLLGLSEKYTIGIAGHHITQPNMSFYGYEDNYYLPLKITFHASANLTLRESVYQNETGKIVMNPGVIYQYQHNYEQYAGGANISYSPLTFGVWYRYSPRMSDAIALLAGISYNNFKIGYSYDFTISDLKSETGGAHELSVGWVVNCDGKRNKKGAIKCPEF